MNTYNAALKSFFVHAIFGGIVALCSLALALIAASELGARELGVFAAWLAWSLIMWPLATLRIESRVLVCVDENDLRDVFVAVYTAALFFLLIVVAGLTLISAIYDLSGWVILVPLTAISYSVLDLCTNSASFNGWMKISIFIRAVRQIVPLVFSLLAVNISPTGESAFAGYSLGSIIVSVICCFCMGAFLPSVMVFRKVFLKYGGGLKASLLLGCVNALWLNGFVPFLSHFGMSYLAGQYSIIQRLLNAPLAVLAAVANSYLVRANNQIHRQPVNMVLVVCMLATIAAVWGGVVYWGLMVQSIYPVADEWKASSILYFSIAVFSVSSFAVGSIALVAARLRDEWFLSVWQVVLVFLGGGVLVWEPSVFGLMAYLFLGGGAYWVLFFRWLILSRRKF